MVNGNPYDVALGTPGWKRRRNRIVTQRVHTPDPALQPPLPTVSPRSADKDDLTIEQRFAEWQRANPGVMALIHQMALARVAGGQRRISTKALIEELRSAPVALADAGEPYRINNVFTSRIARILNADPQLAGLIEMRRLTAE